MCSGVHPATITDGGRPLPIARTGDQRWHVGCSGSKAEDFMRVSTILLSLVSSLTIVACDKATPAPAPVSSPAVAAPAAPVATAPVATTSAGVAVAAAATPPAAAPAPAMAAKVGGTESAPPRAAAPVDGPPAIGRMLVGTQIRAGAPYGRGDYLVALDYRAEGFGTYGYLYAGDGTWWVVEQDVVVGGPLPDGGAAMQQVTARWAEGERQRHEAVMRGVASAPHGCLEGCVFDVYQNGQWAGRRVEY
jgi:hypothetical protein